MGKTPLLFSGLKKKQFNTLPSLTEVIFVTSTVYFKLLPVNGAGLFANSTRE